MAKIRKIKEKELIGGTSNTEVYPITHARAVYDKNNTPLSDTLEFLNTEVVWSNYGTFSNMNDFVVAGVYDIKGERTRNNDKLPILNTGGGHTFNARLTVLDSSIERTEGEPQNNDKCITQILYFDNRLGQGEVYIRTGKGASLENISWDNWSTLQRNVNVVSVESLDDLIDNGIYSGVLNPTGETFVLVVINNYAFASRYGLPKSISQFKYSVSPYGVISFSKRVKVGDGDFPGWNIINHDEITLMINAAVDEMTAYTQKAISTAIEKLIGAAPDTLDTLQEIAEWVSNHQDLYGTLKTLAEDNANKINDEIIRAKEAEKVIDDKLDEEIERSVSADLDLRNMVDDEHRRAEQVEEELDDKITEEKERAEKHLADEIEKLKDGDTIVGKAREIHSRNGKTVTDSFLARTTAGSGTIGDGVATLKSVGGNIIKNNNRVSIVIGNDVSYIGNIVRATPNTNGKVQAVVNKVDNDLTESVSTINGHVYYNSCYIKTNDANAEIVVGKANTNFGYISNTANLAKTTEWQYASYIATSTASSFVLHFTMGVKETTTSPLYVTKVLHVDLTEMFGAGKEPTKEECDKLFGTMDALPQGLSIANPTEFKSTGYNQADPNKVLVGKGIENGVIVDKIDSNLAVVPCLPCKIGEGENNGYHVHGDFGEDIKVYLTPLNPMEVEGELYMHELTLSEKGSYVPQIKGYMIVEVPTTANLCAHFLWSEDCDKNAYEPYYESKIELPRIPEMSEYGLAGLQSSGTLACDEIDFVKGVYRKKIEKVTFNGSEAWYGGGSSSFYTVGVLPISKSRGSQLVNWNGFVKKTTGENTFVLDGSTFYIKPTALNITTVDEIKAYLAQNPLELCYELAEPIEYPLPKVNNNYTSSDYGVEQFDGAVPCNANNLYYMRSLAGETRNFLDKMYANTGKESSKDVADYITEGIAENKVKAEEAPNLALRALFVAAGAEYNDSGADKTKTAPWGETVTHKAGHYYLNGLGDITEKQMGAIYAANYYTLTENISCLYFQSKIRTNICAQGTGWNIGYGTTSARLAFYNSSFEVAVVANPSWPSDSVYCFQARDVASMFDFNNSLKRILGVINVQAATDVKSMFSRCPELLSVKIKGLKNSIDIKNSPNFGKESVIYMLENAVPTSAITITLHADVYARLAEDADIVAALAAQPLITLVSA